MNAAEREQERQARSQQMIEAAYKRNAEDAEAAVIRKPVMAIRVMAELGMLARKHGLSDLEAHRKLVRFLDTKGMSLDEFKREKDKEKNLKLVREAFSTES